MKYLNQKAYFFSRPLMVILINLIIPFTMMCLYEPFEYRLNSASQLQVLLGYFIIVFFTSSIFYYLFPKVIKSDFFAEWTIGKNILYSFSFLLVTSYFSFIYDYHFLGGYGWAEFKNEEFRKYFIMNFVAVFSIGIVPLSINYLLEKNYQLKQNLHEFKLINNNGKPLPINVIVDNSSRNIRHEEICLVGDTKDYLQIDPERIVYIESSSNYVIVYYYEDVLMTKTIRCTIKKIEEQFSGYEYLTRCHRAFIVNTHYIEHAEGNSQNCHLTLSNSTVEIPVSRTYVKHIKACLEKKI